MIGFVGRGLIIKMAEFLRPASGTKIHILTELFHQDALLHICEVARFDFVEVDSCW